MTTDTPSEASMEAAIVALCICAARGEEPSSDAYRHSEICPARGAGVVHRTARALDAAEARGWRKGLEEAAGICLTERGRKGVALAYGDEPDGLDPTRDLWHARGAGDCEEVIRARLSERGEGGANG